MFSDFKKLERKHQTIFSIFIALAVVAFWRGAWGIMDIYFFPGNYEFSSWASLVLGLIILVLTNYATRELI